MNSDRESPHTYWPRDDVPIPSEDDERVGKETELNPSQELAKAYQELERAHQRDQELATKDVVTGLPNRFFFRDRLTQAISLELTPSERALVKRMGCGYRNRRRFRNAIYFHLGGLDLYPEPLQVIQTKS